MDSSNEELKVGDIIMCHDDHMVLYSGEILKFMEMNGKPCGVVFIMCNDGVERAFSKRQIITR